MTKPHLSTAKTMPDPRESTADSRPVKRRGAPRGNKNGLKHGIYVNRFLEPDERPLFLQLIHRLYRDFTFNASSDYMQVELVAFYFLRLAKAQSTGNWDAVERIDRMLRGHLKELKATKLTRETDEPKKPTKTPAEWATEILEKARAELEAGAGKAGAEGNGKSTVRERDGGEPVDTEIEGEDGDDSDGEVDCAGEVGVADQSQDDSEEEVQTGEYEDKHEGDFGEDGEHGRENARKTSDKRNRRES